MHKADDVSLYLLGYPHAELGSNPIDLRSRKGWALVAYLAISGTEQSRESLSTLLWPDHVPDRALASLRNLLWVIRRTPLRPFIETTRSTVRMRTNARLWIDVDWFRAAVAEQAEMREENASRLCEAIALYRGDLLAGLHVDGSSEFDDWLQVESSALRSDLAEAYFRLSERGARDAGTRRALSIARQRLGLASPEEAESRRASAPDVREGQVRGVPRFRAPLLGRSTELDLIGETLADSRSGLVVLVGPGGSGKTYLAAAAAARFAHRFESGAYFVSLAHVETARDFVLALGEALDVPLYCAVPASEERNALPADGIDSLRAIDALLVLDNVEQLPATYPWLAALSEPGAPLRVLATSRHQLDLTQERVVNVEGLPVPKPGASPDRVRASESVQLFLSVAEQIVPGFGPSAEDLKAAASICRAVEGLPLALEMAASWARTASCREIAGRLDACLQDLATSERDVLRRHRSLRAVFAESWGRLSRKQRGACRRLAVFRGPFTAAAAWHVSDLPAATLASLVRRSLVQRLPDGRYELLRVVRALLDERLRADPDVSLEIRRRHAAFYLDLLVKRGAELRTPLLKPAAASISSVFEDIEAAWRFAASERAFDRLIEAAWPLRTFLELRNRFIDGVALLDELAEAACDIPEPVARRAHALGEFFAGLFLIHGEEKAGLDRARHGCTELTRLAFDRDAALAVAAVVGAEHLTYGERTLGVEDLDRSIAVLAAEGAEDHLAAALETHAIVEAFGRSKDAVRTMERAISLREGSGDVWGAAVARVTLGGILSSFEAYAEAETILQDALVTFRRLREDPYDEMALWIELARVSLHTGDVAGARDKYATAYELARTIGARVARGSTAESLARISLEAGEQDLARSYAEEAIGVYIDGGDARRLARCREFVRARLDGDSAAP